MVGVEACGAKNDFRKAFPLFSPCPLLSHLLLLSLPLLPLLSSCVGYFSVAVVKHPDRGNFRKKGFLLAYGYKGLESILLGEVWQQSGKSWL